MRKNVFVLLLIFVVLTGCQAHQPNSKIREGTKENHTIDNIKSLHTQDSTAIGDWYDKHHVLVIDKKDKEYEVNRYNLYSGKSSSFFKTSNQVMSIKRSPDSKMFLLQTSLSEEKIELSFFNRKGELQKRFSFPAYEVEYNWNSFDENRIVVTTFSKDWSFDVYALNIETGEKKHLSTDQPFVQWVSKTNIAYLDNKDLMNNEAPLVKENIETNKKNDLSKKGLMFSNEQKYLLILHYDRNQEGYGTYTFYDMKNQKVREFQVPLLSDYSGWSVPYYGWDSHQHVFYTYKPKYSTNKASYNEEFMLVGFSLETGQENKIALLKEEKPIRVSPDGKYALLGLNGKKIVDLETGETKSLIK